MNLDADLHLHTIYSDSTFSPQELLKAAKDVGLKCIAITDHDSVEGIEPALLWGKKFGIEVIPGIELTAEFNNSEIHILGYFIDYTQKWFLEKLKYLRNVRKQRFFQMVEKLKNFNIYLNTEKIIAENSFASLGRLHLAQELYKKGYVNSLKDAFRLYIGEGKPCYVKKEYILPSEAIDMIKKLQGISVLAHPYLIEDESIVEEVIKQGIEGIEVYHSEHSPSGERKYLELAQRYNLLITGGSDCHGLGKGRILIGEVKIPYSIVERLKEYRNERRKI